jgi:hypothetical protein
MGRWMKIEQKRTVIRKAKAHPAMSQEALAVWAKTEFKLRKQPARNTISDVLKQLINFNETSPFQNKCFALGVGSASTHCSS